MKILKFKSIMESTEQREIENRLLKLVIREVFHDRGCIHHELLCAPVRLFPVDLLSSRHFKIDLHQP